MFEPWNPMKFVELGMCFMPGENEGSAAIKNLNKVAKKPKAGDLNKAVARAAAAPLTPNTGFPGAAKAFGKGPKAGRDTFPGPANKNQIKTGKAPAQKKKKG